MLYMPEKACRPHVVSGNAAEDICQSAHKLSPFNLDSVIFLENPVGSTLDKKSAMVRILLPNYKNSFGNRDRTVLLSLLS